MFKNLKEFFLGRASLEIDKSGEVSSLTLKVATAALMWEVANVDNEYRLEEREAIVSSLIREFKVPDDEAQELLEMAEAVSRGEGNLEEFIKAVNEYFTPEQKQLVLAMVWRVAMADGIIKDVESAFAAELQSRLDLKPEQWEKAKELARKEPFKLHL